ncbi:MAG: hypothetical protein AMK69_11040 [Nitrospira bacterium SG8_3]|nr:MAG: hypothetical protein AMK69_11040 [Nitrospira bacterium SG8_3]
MVIDTDKAKTPFGAYRREAFTDEAKERTVQMILKTILSEDPEKAAYWFSTILAVDKGIPSEVCVLFTGASYLVTTDNGEEIWFVKPGSESL